jgi:hypothetical protein
MTISSGKSERIDLIYSVMFTMTLDCPEIVVDFPSVCDNGHAVRPTEPFVKLCNFSWIFVGHLQIIHVPTHCHLFTANQLFGYAWIIRIQLEFTALQVSHEFPIEQQCALQQAIEHLLHLDIEDGRVLFVYCNILLVKIWNHLSHQLG